MQDKEEDLFTKLTSAGSKVDAALLDSINLSGAMDALFELVDSANKYMHDRRPSAENNEGVPTLYEQQII